MLKTDYSKVSKNYDKNTVRLSFNYEPVIAQILAEKGKATILDLGCGTGNYIKCQNQYYENNKNIKWYGIDPSNEMLEKAKTKEPDVEYINCAAEDMEFDESFFDLIVCTFAFHHFTDKTKVLDNVAGCIKKNGIFKYLNIVPEFMKDWWVYKNCPETYCEDLHRFWPKDMIVYELEKRGFSVDLEITYKETNADINKLLEDYTRRDVSQLAMIPDEYYKKGLKKIRSEIESGIQEYKNIYALMEITAKKQK